MKNFFINKEDMAKMKNKNIKSGDRVNVKERITENWQSEKSLLNGFVYKVVQRHMCTYVTVWADENSEKNGLNGGVYALGAYEIDIFK